MLFIARCRNELVKANTLISRLRREITSSPKKAVILGLLLVVAVVYWSPLVWGWIKPESDKKKKKTSVAASANELPAGKPVSLGTANAPTNTKSKHAWKDVAQWIEGDPRMITASEAPGRKHPFDSVQLPSAILETKTQKGITAAASISSVPSDPSSLGLKLSSTIIGRQKKAALINGKSYLLGATIRLEHDGRSFEFQLTEINDDSIVLQRDNKPYTVRLPKPESTDRLSINPLRND